MLPTKDNAAWFDGSGIFYEFIDLLKLITSHEGKIHIGSDSQIRGNRVHFAIAICLIAEKRDRKYFIHRIRRPVKEFINLGMRLQEEVLYSTQLASYLRDKLGLQDLCVHIDSSSVQVNKSAKFTKTLSNIVIGSGFECLVKPDSWASFSVADRHTK